MEVSGTMCLAVTPEVQKLTDKIVKLHPEACQRAGFNAEMCAEWVGAYNKDNNRNPDFIPPQDALIKYIERKRNQDGKSFLYIPDSITYTPKGKTEQTYTIIGTHIYNKDGKEVFKEDSKDRRKIYANLAVQDGRAVVVEHKGKKYVVNKRNQIISVQTGDEMQWDETNADRNNIIGLATVKFNEIAKPVTTTLASTLPVITPTTSNISSFNFYSGGATGSDTFWGETIATNGGRVNHITTKEYDSLSEEDKDKIETEYQDVVKVLGRKSLAATSYSGKLVRRDMMQANNADQVIAVGSLEFGFAGKSEEIYSSPASVKGGTAYAVTRAILSNKPVYLFNQDTNQWLTYDQETKSWKPSNIPTLLNNTAVVGTRELKDNGKQAIKDVLKQTVGQEIPAANNELLEQFKKNIDTLAGYYEGGGAKLTDDIPNLPDELNMKLAHHFMDGTELTIEDYRQLWKYIEFDNNDLYNGIPVVKARQEYTAIVPNVSQNSQVKVTTLFDRAVPLQFSSEEEAHAKETLEKQKTIIIQAEKPKSAAYDSALKTNESRSAQFKRTFSPQQIKDRGAMISNEFSNILDEAIADEIESLQEVVNSDTATQDEKNQAKQRINALKDPVNGRQLAARTIGIPSIINQIVDKLKFYRDNADEAQRGLWQNTIDYFEELFNSQATLDIEEREGIRIMGLTIAKETPEEEQNQEESDGNDETGHYASGSDGWSFTIRYENPFNSLSKKVRSMMYDVERPASQVDDLGQVRHYPMGQIYASMLSYLSKNMTNPDKFLQVIKNFDRLPESLNGSYTSIESEEEFQRLYPNGYPTFPVLEEMRNMYSWISQIIDRLTDDYLLASENTNLRYPSTGGALASQMYTNFRKAYIPYGKIQIGTNNYGITPLNYQMEDRAQYDKLEANYNNRMILSDRSIYNADGKVNKENAKYLINAIKSALSAMKHNDIDYIARNLDSEDISAEDLKLYNEFINSVREIMQSFGIDATQDSVVTYLMMEPDGVALSKMLADLDEIAGVIANLDDSRIDTYNYLVDTKNSYGTNMWNHFFDGRGLITDASYMQSYYDSASHKTKYSYSADNYLMKTFRGVANGTLEERREFIDSHFGKYEWFKNQKTGEWRNRWLEFWYNYPGNTSEIPYRNIDNVTEYDDEGNAIVRPYMKWIEDDIWQIQDRSYDAEKYANPTAFYLAPIFSDSPMSMTVKGPRMSMDQLLYGYEENGVHHSGAFVNLVNQELWRIGYVQDRAKAIKEGRVKPIANFDTGKGQKFCFIPELNTFRYENGELFIDRMIRLKNSNASMTEIEANQIAAIQSIMEAQKMAYMMENMEHYTEKQISDEQYYNMSYANAAIIQLTTSDLAFYKDFDDFQKRFKEVYAGGIQLNTNSKYGRKYENIVLVADDIITSPSYSNIAAVIDASTSLTGNEKERIKSIFTKVNVADAQAIRSMHSFRSILDMMGQWDDRMEEALNHFKEGVWSAEDFDVIYQTIKPFVYAMIDRNDGFGGQILVPQQNKNSEICALMMYDLITNDLGKSPVYKALSKFMENTVDAEGNPLIDMIQYESAGKVGNQGVVNISFNPNKVIDLIDNGKNGYNFLTAYKNDKYLDNTVENAADNYKAIKDQLDDLLKNGEMSQADYNEIFSYMRPTEEEIIDMLEKAVLVTNLDGSKGINTEVVHTIPFDCYYQQQPTPEHHIDAEATFGSQARNISVADLPENFEIVLPGKRGESKTFKGKDAVIDFFYELLNENLIEDFFGKDGKSGLKGLFANKESLRDAVTEIVRGNPKYSRDFAEALQINESGNFVLSPNSPTMFTLMQEIITSFFKNRITKQKINGAALIQAAGIDLSDELNVVFDEDGKLVGAECYMPLTSRRFFEPLLETKVINGEKVQVLSPKKLKKAGLDKAIGYRIPTENKSSMLPLIIKGFTPLQNGSAIVLPAEITAIAGSDFDVDKMFLMLSSFYIQNYDMAKARTDFARENEEYKAIMGLFSKSQLIEDIMDEEPMTFKEWFENNKDNYLLDEPIIRKIEYDWNKTPKENGRRARNNMLIQMIYNILTSKAGTESLLNPQGFPDVEYVANVNRILSTPQLLRKWINTFGEEEATDALISATEETLAEFIKKNKVQESPIYPQAFAHLHARNMAGAIQIGIYAIQGSMAAKFQRATIRMKEQYKYTINGRQISNVDVSDEGKRLKNVGQMIGASADNGKKPNLTDMGSTTDTAPIIGFMLRSGLSHLEASLLINQPCMQMSNFNPNNWKVFGRKPMMLPQMDISTKTLMQGIMNPDSLTQEEKDAILGMCYRILKQNEAIEYITQVSRADSPNGALKNSYAKARIQKYKVDLMQAKMAQRDFPFNPIKEMLSNDAIDVKASEDVIREQLKGQKVGFLHGMYALGINSFSSLVAPYFFGAQEWFDNDIVKPILYNLNERMSDEKKERIVNQIYTSYITFILSGSTLFGNEDGASMKSKRDYYLNTFPSDYQKLLAENEEIRNLLSTVLQVKQFGNRKRIILQDVGSISKGQKQDIQRRFESLAYSDDEKVRKFAEDLLMYSYYDNGLNFTNDSFSTMFTTEFLNNFPIYNETLQNLDREIIEDQKNNFIAQFLLTFPGATIDVSKFIDDTNIFDDGNVIKIDLNDRKFRQGKSKMINDVMSPNPIMEGVNVYPYISIAGNDVYILDKEAFEADKSHPTYHKINKYATSSYSPLFSSQISIDQLVQEFPTNNSLENIVSNIPSIEEGPATHNDSNEDSNIDNSENEALDIMEGFEEPDFIPDALPTSQEEQYHSEGESEMQQPFCNIVKH